jgi:rRNA maturation endonuclease Nob1
MELTLNELVLGVIFGSLVLVSGISLLSRMLHWKTEQRLARTRTVCRLCGHIFISGHEANLNHCEACGALNRRRGNGKLG